MVQLIIDGIEISPLELEKRNEIDVIAENLSQKYDEVFTTIVILRKSLDARKKSRVFYLYRVCVTVNLVAKEKLLSSKNVSLYKHETKTENFPQKEKMKILIVGAGPSGLFCALRLIESGVDVTILERGKDTESRDTDLAMLKSKGILNLESNVLFGEGGAGTYSDGKLTTRIHHGPIEYFFRRMIEMGAPESITYETKPHVGTDVLKEVIVAIRESILSSGSRIVFNERVDSLITENNFVKGVKCASDKEYFGDAVIFAAGHSARDSFSMLKSSHVSLQGKSFSVGMRIEHPSEFINKSQYGQFSASLPAADYRLAYNDQETKRGVYSFCMCPGGEVINSSSEQGLLCVNGMSYSHRNSPFSNSAIVTTVSSADFGVDPMDGIEFQRNFERKAFELGGGYFAAPIQSMRDFIKGINSGKCPKTSYLPNVKESNLSLIFPPFIRKPMIRGLLNFDQKIRGFIDNGVCIGVETRTSSPVRILRDEFFESVSHKNLYPIGEGAGYAGGIVSSAVDGIRCAEMILSTP